MPSGFRTSFLRDIMLARHEALQPKDTEEKGKGVWQGLGTGTTAR